MEEAYVMVNAVPGQENKAMLAIKEIAEVREVKGVFGVYDLVANLRAANLQTLESAVAKIRSNHSVMGTLTMSVIQN